MESSLNIIWLLVAIGLVLVWRERWIAQRSHTQRRPMAEWAALGCVLVFLFFAISLTDDLHQSVVVSDDVSSHRRQSPILSAADDSHRDALHVSASFLLVPFGRAFIPSLTPVGRVDVYAAPHTPLARYEDQPNRAPPVSLLS